MVYLNYRYYITQIVSHERRFLIGHQEDQSWASFTPEKEERRPMSEYLRVFTVYKYRSLFPGLTKYIIKTNRKPVIKGIIPEKIYTKFRNIFLMIASSKTCYWKAYTCGDTTPSRMSLQHSLSSAYCILFRTNPGISLQEKFTIYVLILIQYIRSYEINYRYISQLVVIAE